MKHLEEEAVTRAATVERTALLATERSHLGTCASCRGRVEATIRLAAALREAEPPAEHPVPSFDALVAPQLAPEPVPSVSPGQALRLTVAVTLRQARLAPRLLWLVTVGGFAALAAVVVVAPQSSVALTYLSPVTVALVTIGAVAVCDPQRDPLQESMHAMLVPPVVVWLSRLAFVLGAVLLMAIGVSVLAAALPGGGQGPGAVIGAWLSPALLGVGVTTFGAVWRSPAVGMVFGAASWAMSVAVAREDVFGSPAGSAVAAIWTDTAVALPLAAFTLAAAAWLASRSSLGLGEG